MTAETGLVRIHSAGDRERNTSISRAMTTVTSGATMFCVIEFAVETPQRRERFHRTSLSVCMTDRADWTTAGKERLMTANTRRVLIFSRQGWSHCIVFAPVTQQTRQSRVIRIVVLKL